MLRELKARAQKAQETTRLIENASAQAGIEINSVKAAVGQGATSVKEDAARILASSKSAVEMVDNEDEEIDLSAL